MRQTSWLAVFVAVASVVALPCHATQPGWEAIRERIVSEELFEDRTWLALGHYRRAWPGSGWESQADRADFFVSPKGKHDPREELLETARALLSGGEDPALRCRFPARDLWLRRELRIEGPSAREECPELREWYQALASREASIQFASAYLESPSSMFGHTFLRFHMDGVPPLMQPTLNYAADSSQRTGPLAFVVRGLFGGFPGVADQLPYYRRLRTYGDDEGRDIWSYPLRLQPGDIELLLLHLWEIRSGAFDYFFLDENCAYRTLQLIALTRPDLELPAALRDDVVPIETIKALRDKGLVGEPAYVPSSVKKLSWRVRAFSHADLERVRDIATGSQAPASVNEMQPARRAELLRAAADYQAILVARGKIPLEDRDRVVPALIRERLALAHPLPDDPVPAPSEPDAAHSGRTVSIAVVNERGAVGADLGYAGFRHSLTDPLEGYSEGAAVTVLAGSLRFLQGGAHRVQSFDLLRVTSSTPTTMLLPHRAWSLYAGLQRKWIEDERPLVGSLSFGSGKAAAFGGTVVTASLGASLDAGPVFAHDVALEAEARLGLARQAYGWSYEAFAVAGNYFLGSHDRSLDYGLQVGIPLGSASLQLVGRRNEFAVELRKYF